MRFVGFAPGNNKFYGADAKGLKYAARWVCEYHPEKPWDRASKT